MNAEPTKYGRVVAGVPQKKVDDICELYIKYGGREVRLFEAEMRERGWSSFSYRSLYPDHNNRKLGWIQRLNLLEFLEPERRRELVRRYMESGFQGWLSEGTPGFKWNWKYQKLIYRKLRAVSQGDCRRLMIFLPPRHGKSELVTIRFAAWSLFRRPEMRIVIGSYNQKLANRFSRRIRHIYDSSLQAVGRESEKSRHFLNTSSEWETVKGGGVKAVGAGAGITGFGADLLIIDDPIKGRSEAESANNRERVWDWFNDDLHTRLEPNGGIILIQTRWHEDDLAGRLLREAAVGGEQWEVVSLPALAEEDDPLGRQPGEALCPKRFDREALLQKKRKLGSYSFAALYQQRPAPAEGGLFRREWFRRIVDAAPEGLRWYRGYDLAVSIKETADYTASFRCALDRTTGDLYIADGFRKRLEFPEQRRYILERIKTETDTEHGIEEALHGQAFLQELWRDSGISRFAFRGVRARGDKLTRALSWANRAEAGKVVLVRGTWIDDLMEEICSFPYGRHDDQIDAISIAVEMMESPRRQAYGF